MYTRLNIFLILSFFFLWVTKRTQQSPYGRILDANNIVFYDLNIPPAVIRWFWTDANSTCKGWVFFLISQQTLRINWSIRTTTRVHESPLFRREYRASETNNKIKKNPTESVYIERYVIGYFEHDRRCSGLYVHLTGKINYTVYVCAIQPLCL